MNPEDPVEKKPSTDSDGHTYIPIPDWLLRYQKSWLRPDMIAGLTSAAVVIPKPMEYAAIAGLPVQAGLYTVLAPMAIYAVNREDAVQPRACSCEVLAIVRKRPRRW